MHHVLRRNLAVAMHRFIDNPSPTHHSNLLDLLSHLNDVYAPISRDFDDEYGMCVVSKRELRGRRQREECAIEERDNARKALAMWLAILIPAFVLAVLSNLIICGVMR